jgi:hypothetical protein
MKRNKINLLILFALIAMSFALLGAPASAQHGNANQKTNSRILYHDGPVMTGSTDVYLIWYGNWPSNSETKAILTDFVSFLGGSAYFQINTTYTDSTGAVPNGALLYAGSVNDVYSHGLELTALDIQGIVADSVTAGNLPLDTTGIYIVFGSSDISSNSTGFCTPSAPPHHGAFSYNGVPLRYAFIGNAARCPTSAAPQFIAPDGSQLPTPNGNLAADAMASTLAHALDTTVTNPTGTAWFDRYGLENADKCQGTFGQTYTTANGARANMRLGTRHYFIQQNWVNVRRGYCGLSYP